MLNQFFGHLTLVIGLLITLCMVIRPTQAAHFMHAHNIKVWGRLYSQKMDVTPFQVKVVRFIGLVLFLSHLLALFHVIPFRFCGNQLW